MTYITLLTCTHDYSILALQIDRGNENIIIIVFKRYLTCTLVRTQEFTRAQKTQKTHTMTNRIEYYDTYGIQVL